MKYWFYADGNILGPYAPAELLSMPAFGHGSLVCPETSGGDNPADWHPAEEVCEIAEALSVGAGSVLPGQYGAAFGSYEPSGPASAYYEAQNGPVEGYGNLLDTIDNILGAYKDAGGPSEVKLPPDFELMNNFDIRLSKIQEELEAARWEKNLLLEKMRSRDSEERKNRELIAELEDKLREALRNAAPQEKKSSTAGAAKDLPAGSATDLPAAVGRPAPLEAAPLEITPLNAAPLEATLLEAASFEVTPPEAAPFEITPLEAAPPAAAPFEIAPLEAAPQAAAPFEITPLEAVPPVAAPADKLPAAGPATLKKLRSIRDVRHNEGVSGGIAGGGEGEPLIVKPLWSAGRKSAPGGERFSVPAEAARQLAHFVPKTIGQSAGPAEPFVTERVNAGADAATGTYGSQTAKGAGQAPGADYDFAAIARSSQETGVPQTKIVPVHSPQPSGAEPGAEASAQALPSAQQQSPSPASGYPMFSGQSGQTEQSQAATAWFARQAEVASSQGAAATIPFPHFSEDAAAAALKETAVEAGRQTERIPLTFQSQKEDAQKSPAHPVKGRRKMAFIAILIGFACVAAIGLALFFFSGGSSSESAVQNLGGGKAQDAAGSAKPGPQPGDGQAASGGAEAQQAPAAPPVQPAFKSASNENIIKAIETVKAYKLSGGRGRVEVWFANSFLSGSASGSNEEWSATLLHGDIFLVQYRLLRPKQEPLSYEFEVDVTKEVIVRGINNNAMELLESNAAPAPGPKAGKKRKFKAPNIFRPKKSGGISILPLPEPAARAEQGFVPTGFETADSGGSEKVKYLVAQESDEELF